MPVKRSAGAGADSASESGGCFDGLQVASESGGCFDQTVIVPVPIVQVNLEVALIKPSSFHVKHINVIYMHA